MTRLGSVFKPFDPPQPGLKRVENERQSPPVLLEVLGKQSYTLAFERFLTLI